MQTENRLINFFDKAYERFCECLITVAQWPLFDFLIWTMVYATMPVWIIPYVIIKKIGEEKNGLESRS